MNDNYVDLSEDGDIWYSKQFKEIHLDFELPWVVDLKEFHDLIVKLSDAFIKACEEVKK